MINVSAFWAAQKQQYSLWLLAGILIVAAGLRLPMLSQVPSGFYCDEASNGYDAYSILMTGRDRHGKFLPLFPKAFGEYKEGANIYYSIPFIALFGLNEWSVRMYSAVIGLLTIGLLYLLVKEAFDTKTALAAALFLTVSPWHMHFSRVALQCILFPLPFCAALLFFLKGIKGAVKNLYISIAFFCLSLWTFFPARAFVPGFFLVLVCLYARELCRLKKHAGIAMGIFIVGLILFMLFWFSPQGTVRMNQVKNFELAKNVRNYFTYFSPSFLFLRGDRNLRHSMPFGGELQLFEVITVLIGLGVLLVRVRKKESRLFLLWLILFPFPAMFSYTSATRSFSGALILAVISGVGFTFLASLWRTKQAKKIFYALSLMVIFISTGIYAHHYFIEYPRKSAYLWQYGMREAIMFTQKSACERIIISNQWGEKTLHQAYIFVLFFTRYDPHILQRDVPRIHPWGRGKFGKYHILRVPEDLDVPQKSLLITTPSELKSLPSNKYDWETRHVIKGPRGKELLKIIEICNKKIN